MSQVDSKLNGGTANHFDRRLWLRPWEGSGLSFPATEALNSHPHTRYRMSFLNGASGTLRHVSTKYQAMRGDLCFQTPRSNVDIAQVKTHESRTPREITGFLIGIQMSIPQRFGGVPSNGRKNRASMNRFGCGVVYWRRLGCLPWEWRSAHQRYGTICPKTQSFAGKTTASQGSPLRVACMHGLTLV